MKSFRKGRRISKAAEETPCISCFTRTRWRKTWKLRNNARRYVGYEAAKDPKWNATNGEFVGEGKEWIIEYLARSNRDIGRRRPCTKMERNYRISLAMGESRYCQLMEDAAPTCVRYQSDSTFRLYLVFLLAIWLSAIIVSNNLLRSIDPDIVFLVTENITDHSWCRIPNKSDSSCTS